VMGFFSFFEMKLLWIKGGREKAEQTKKKIMFGREMEKKGEGSKWETGPFFIPHFRSNEQLGLCKTTRPHRGS